MNIIYYFTGTGNSLALARELAEKLGDTEVKPMAKNMGATVGADVEAVGLVYPVYAWGMPLIAVRFVNQLNVEGKPYMFAVANCGGSAGAAVLQARKLLKRKGLALACGFVLYMPPNYLPMGGAIPEDEQRQRFAKATERVDELVALVKDKKTGPIERSVWYARLLTTPIYVLFKGTLAKADKKFVVSDGCNQCQICVKICPVDNIELKDGQLVWKHQCEQCFACIQWCPQEGIDIGTKTRGKKRYHHPEVRAKDLI